MRTTVNIHDALLQEAKELAVRTGRPLGQVVDDALTLLLSRVHEGVPPNPAPLPTYGGSGLQPGVDLEDKEALSALLDPDEDRPRAGL